MPTRRLTRTLASALLLAACGPDKDTTESAGTTAAATSASSPTGSATDTPTGGSETGGSGLLLCADHCTKDADCLLHGMDFGQTCIDSRCTAEPCTDSMSCTVSSSGWTTACAAQADCPGQVCIDIGGKVGRCATAPEVSITCMPSFTEIPLPPIEGGADLTVCARNDAVCDAASGVCLAGPCDDDSDCVAPFSPVCDAATGVCGCQSDADCASVPTPGYTHCNAGLCGCESDTDCAGNPGGTRCTARGNCGCAFDAECTNSPHFNTDTCYDGICGCSRDASCTKPQHDGATQKCEPA